MAQAASWRGHRHGRIVASLLTTKDADDGSQVGPLLDRVEELLASFTGDGAYDQESVTASIGFRHLRAIAEHGRMAWQAASGYS